MKHDCAAPVYKDILPQGAQNCQACWHYTEDNVQIRSVFWPSENAKGAVLLFTGRTEYCEKYGDVAEFLVNAGMHVIAFDWRGQGLSVRPLPDRQKGHVENFLDYQRDITAVVQFVQQIIKPMPYYLLSHSMGGAIALRALMNGLDVKAACFSAPMWGIKLALPLTTVAQTLGWGLGMFGADDVYVPGGGPDPSVITDPFEGNTITADPDTYARMAQQVTKHPDLGLGSPTIHWLDQALDETDALAKLPSPDMPCLTFMGSNERIVRPDRIIERMANWPNGELITVDGQEHEVLMTKSAVSHALLRQIVDHFTAHS